MDHAKTGIVTVLKKDPASSGSVSDAVKMTLSSSTSSTKEAPSHSKNPPSKHDKSSTSSNEGFDDTSNAPQINGDLNLDLALDFPALPSPNSPNETGSNGSANRSASSLKV